MLSRNIKQSLSQILVTGYAPRGGGLADFTVVPGDDGWHLFHIYYEFSKPMECHAAGQCDKIGHATSPDLVNWTSRPPALAVRPKEWDCRHLWAPHVVRHEGLWYMCYTGVDHGLHQRLGVVTSTDLYDWDYPPNQPGVDADDFPWSKAPQVLHTKDEDFPDYVNCRDPYLLHHDGQWLCYYTGNSEPDGVETPVIGLASSHDLLTWRDEGFVAHAPTRNGEDGGTWHMESPCVFQRGGVYYLVYNQGLGIRYTFSDTPLDFTENPVHRLMDGIFNFDIIDPALGLFAFAPHAFYATLRFGIVNFREDHTMEMDLGPGWEGQVQ